MPHSYFEPENMKALMLVFEQAKAILEKRGLTDPHDLDFVAHRILRLASEGVEPSFMLAIVLKEKWPAIDMPADSSSGAKS